MADIAWTGYALAMFTPEQLAAAANGQPDPLLEPGGVPLPKPPANPGASGLPVRITGPGIPAAGYDPNKPDELQKIYALGWRFEAGRWIAPASPGVPATPDAVFTSGGGRPAGSLSSVQSVVGIGGGSVLGIMVPAAPAVLLPQWVGGRIGRVVVSGGTRPESGGVPTVIRGTAPQYSWLKVVR